MRLWILVAVPAIFFLAYFYPGVPFISELNLCAVRHFLGAPCPGCGLTASFIELTHARPDASIEAHPLGIIVAVWLLYMFGRALFTAIKGHPPKDLLTQGPRDLVLGAFLIALVVQWITRLL